MAQPMNMTSVPESSQPFKPRPRWGRRMFYCLLLLLVAAVAGYGGYWYEKNRSDKQLSDLQSKVGQSTGDASHGITTGVKALTVKEWGIEIPLPDALSGLAYRISGDSASFTSSALEASDPQCGDGAIGVITRVKQLSGQYAGVNAPRVADYYYVYVHPQASCSSDSSISQQQSTYASLLQGASVGLRSSGS